MFVCLMFRLEKERKKLVCNLYLLDSKLHILNLGCAETSLQAIPSRL